MKLLSNIENVSCSLRRILNVLSLIPIFFSFLACSKLPDEDLPVDDEAAEQIDTDYPCDDCKFRSAGFSHSHLDGKQLLFKLEAREVIKRARQGQFLRFSDYDELYLDGLYLMQFVSSTNRFVQFDLDEFYRFTDLKSDKIQSLVQTAPPGNNQIGSPEQSPSPDKLLTNQLNRILAKPIQIEFHPEKQAKITINADYAQMLTDSMNIAFDGNLKISAKRCLLSADSALWSNQHQGLLFLDGVNFNGKIQSNPRFIKLQANGFCKISRQSPDISDEDKLAAIENQMIIALPIEYQILLGLAGTQASSLEPNN